MASILTILSMLVPLGSLFFVGLPITRVLFPAEKENRWIIAPFLGLAVIVLFLQNLLYLGVPVEVSFYWVWITVAILWLPATANKLFSMYKTGVALGLFSFARRHEHEKNKPSDRTPVIIAPIEKSLLAVAAVAGVACLVYMLHAMGLWMVGAEYYVGRGWYDQFNYVSATQFFVDHGLANIHLSDLMYQPSAIRAYWLTTADRIGQCVFTAFTACNLATDAKFVFEPVILMSPFLIVLAVYAIARRFLLTEKTSLIIAAVAGSLPCLAMMHLEAFISQALVTPLLLLWPLILVTGLREPNWKKTIGVALLLAGATSIYVEYFILFLAITAVYVMWEKSWVTARYVLLIILLALCLNLGFFRHLIEIGVRSAQGLTWAKIYPWADSLEGLRRLWIGDFTVSLAGWRKHIFDGISILLFVAAYAGFFRTLYKKPDSFHVTLFALMLLPLGIFFLGMHHYAYQFYKVVVSISPLFPLGIVLAWRYVFKPAYYQIGCYLATLVVFISLSATVSLILLSTNVASLAQVKRGVGYKLLLPETLEVQDKLLALHHQNIVIAWQDDFRQGDFLNGWLSYFARNNRIWLLNPRVGDMNLQADLASSASIPKHYLLLTIADAPRPAAGKKIWGNSLYQLWDCHV